MLRGAVTMIVVTGIARSVASIRNHSLSMAAYWYAVAVW